MASLLKFSISFHLLILLSIINLTPTKAVFSSEHISKSSPQNPTEKTTKLHFFFHDTITGRNPTAMQIIPPPNGAVGGFGTTFMMDDPLTEGPDPTSKLIGRSQGIYAVAAQHEFGLLMVLNFVFTEGIYNGSTLSILGRNPTQQKVREMPVVGGTGVFRFARGFATAKMFMFNPKAGVAIVEYNVCVLHV